MKASIRFSPPRASARIKRRRDTKSTSPRRRYALHAAGSSQKTNFTKSTFSFI
jgi:hypothetical protein